MMLRMLVLLCCGCAHAAPAIHPNDDKNILMAVPGGVTDAMPAMPGGVTGVMPPTEMPPMTGIPGIDFLPPIKMPPPPPPPPQWRKRPPHPTP